MTDCEDCLHLLLEFVHRGDIGQAGIAAGTILAYLTKLDGKEAQLAAIRDLRVDLSSRCESEGVSGLGEARHVAVENALEQASIALEREAHVPGEELPRREDR